MDMMKRCCIYVRVSSERQVEGYSLDSQTDICTKEASRQGFEVVKIFREEGVSAKTLDRPELADLLRFVKDKKNAINAIFVYHTSRLSRNTLDFLTLKSLFAKIGVSLISASEPIDGDTPEQKFLSTIMSAVNQLENEMRGRNVANSLKKRFFEGHITSKPPLGYLMQKVEGKSIAVKDPVWFPILQVMWERVEAEHLSMRQIADELNKYKLHRFSRGSVEKIFKNKFYYGILTSQKYGETQGKHEAMIDERTYYAVQFAFKAKAFPIQGRTALREDFKLRMIIRCPYCNHRLTSGWTKGKCKKYAYYFCLNCEHRDNYGLDKAELQFMALLQKVRPTPKFLTFFRDIIKERYELEHQELSISRDTVLKDVEALEGTLKRIRDKHRDGIYTDEEYLDMKEEIKIQIVAKQSLVSEKKMDIKDIDTVLNFMEFYLNNLDKIFLKSSPEGRMKIGCSIFPEGVFFDGTNYRTPTIGLGYALIKQFEALPSNLVSRLGFEPRTNSLKGYCSTVELPTLSGAKPYGFSPTLFPNRSRKLFSFAPHACDTFIFFKSTSRFFFKERLNYSKKRPTASRF